MTFDSYEIRITGTRTVVKHTKDWLRKHDDDKRDDQYAYVEADRPVNESVEVLRQTVDALDVAAVIKAINGL